MPTTCCVRGCKSRGSGKDNKIKYFRFPKDEERRVLWVRAIHRENFVPTNNSMICNAHFTKDDYQKRPDLIKLTNKAVPSIFNSPENLTQNIKQKIMDSDLNSSQNPVKKFYSNLSDHTYVLKLPELTETEEMSPEKTIIDPSTCMIQTLKVQGEDVDEPHVLDLSRSNENKPTSKSIEDLCLAITTNDQKSFEDLNKDWRQIAIAQSHTIKDLRKKVKVLQQKIRRHTTKIETLKGQLGYSNQN